MKILKYIGLGLLGLLVVVLLWGVIEPKLYDVERETASVPNLPAAWEGERVALLADFQVGMWMGNEGTVRRIVDQIIEEQPGVVLIAGDFVYPRKGDATQEIETAVELVRPLVEAGVPTVAVLGNHDYGLNKKKDPIEREIAQELRTALEAAGIEVLQNESYAVPSPGTMQTVQTAGSALHIVGIGSSWADAARPGAALDAVPAGAARLVLMHNPDAYEDIPSGDAPLALAGHTHGGQFRLPLTPEWSWMTFAKEDAVHADGWIDDYGAAGNRLYVNRGIGMSAVPLRFNCMPELTFFTLQPGEA